MTQPFDLTPRQKQVRAMLAKPAMRSLIYGGSRSGKTFLICYAISMRALRASGSRHLISRLQNIDVRQSVMLDTWPKVMRSAFPTVKYKVNKSDQFATLDNGSEIWFTGLDDKDRVEKVLGKEYATIYTNEASQVAFATQETLRTRLAQGVAVDDTALELPLREYIDLNPTGRAHWTYKEFVEKVAPLTGQPLPNPEDYQYAVMNPMDNPMLPKAYIKALQSLSERQRRRYFEGEYLSDVPGALWRSETIEANRVSSAPYTQTRLVVAVDPPAGEDGEAAECGIVVACCVGHGIGAHAYVIADRSMRGSPAEWAATVVRAYNEFKADAIVAEINQGGAMVKHTLRTADASAVIKTVHASRGKATRAEPISALYSNGQVHHVGVLRELEDQLTSWVPGTGQKSPDRLDALVWALTELMMGPTQAQVGKVRT